MWKVLAASAVFAVGLVSAPAAAADPTEFLDSLGFTLPGLSAEETVAAGYSTCDALRESQPTRTNYVLSDEMDAVEAQYGFTEGFDFVFATVLYLCPEFSDALHPYTQ